MLCAASDLVNDAFADGLRPDPRITVSEWANTHRKLSQKDSAEPGPYRWQRTPYVREVMDCLTPQSRVREVVLMWGAQTAKTTVGNNWIGSIMDMNPGPTMAVQPTVDMAKRFSKQRIDPMIADTPKLRETIGTTRSRDSSNTMLQKDFPAGTLVMTGANSATGLRSMPVKNLFGDETDAWPGDVDGEGDPMDLAERRTATFEHTRKVLWTSTPTIAGRSKIEAKYYHPNATQEVYKVPCPHCAELQLIDWKRIKYEEDDGLIVGDPYLECEHCEEAILERHKDFMLNEINGAHWEAQNERADGSIRSFWISSLYSPLGWFSWKRACEMWVSAKGNPEKLRTFVNTVLGEPYEERGEAPSWERLFGRRLPYKINTLPTDNCLLLTAGADVQKNRIEIEVVAWGPNGRSWSVDYRVFVGDTSEEEVWEGMDRIVNERWMHPSGVPIQISKLCVDANYNTQAVYNWCRKHPASRVMAVRGGPDTQKVIIASPTVVDINYQGKKFARGTMVWTLGVGILKKELYSWLRREPPINEDGTPAPKPYGWCDFPEYAPEHFKQLCAEEMKMEKDPKGYRKPVWHKRRERNEALDCRVYARAGAEVAGVTLFTEDEWQMLRESQGLIGSTGGRGESNKIEDGESRKTSKGKPPRRFAEQVEKREPRRPYKGYLDRWRHGQ
jgi:phage terminase large subunit GpA-like protein